MAFVDDLQVDRSEALGQYLLDRLFSGHVCDLQDLREARRSLRCSMTALIHRLHISAQGALSSFAAGRRAHGGGLGSGRQTMFAGGGMACHYIGIFAYLAVPRQAGGAGSASRRYQTFAGAMARPLNW